MTTPLDMPRIPKESAYFCVMGIINKICSSHTAEKTQIYPFSKRSEICNKTVSI